MSLFPVAHATLYGNADGTGAQTTSYAYSWLGGSVQAGGVTATLPAVSAAQNGPGAADAQTVTYDSFGRATRYTDADGFTHTAQYDPATGAVTRTVVDAGPYAATVLADRPVGFWRLGEAGGTTAGDASGQGHGGTYQGGYTRGQAGAVASDADKAVAFGGSSGYVSVPTDAAFGLTPNLTVEGWFKTTSSGDQYITTKGEDSWYLATSGGNVGIWFNGPSSAGPGWVFSPLTYNDGTWHHAAATYDGGTIKLYVDGALVNSVSASGTVSTGTGDVRIGRRGPGADGYWSGALDEVAVYGSALSADRVAAHYAAGHAALPSAYAAVAGADGPSPYLRLGETGGTADADASGNGHGGTYPGTYTLGQAGLPAGDGDAAASLNGGSVTVAASAAFDTADLTLEAWIKPAWASGGPGYSPGVAGVRNGGGTRWSVHVASDYSAVYVWNGSSVVTLSARGSLGQNAAAHLAVTLRSGVWRLYVNGTLRSTSGGGNAVGSATSAGGLPLNVGASGGGENFAGTIDEFALYPRALASDQILAHYDAGHTAAPAPGHLALTTATVVDAFGRPTKLTDPAGHVTYVTYDDLAHETRVYRGWHLDAATGRYTTTGPVEVTRIDRPGSYGEWLTYAPATFGTGVTAPDGTDAISDVRTLARDYTNGSNQLVRSDRYFDLSGVTYSHAANLGTLGVNYYRTTYDYDQRGRVSRVRGTVGATSGVVDGTIYRTVNDGLGRAVSTWARTNDTPSDASTGGYWRPDNNTGSADMVELAEYQYDGGGVGDSNLTRETDHPGLSQPDRVSQLFYDWRDRAVAAKSGVQTAESDGTHRPVAFVAYDNLDEVTSAVRYDGDGVTLTAAMVADADNNGLADGINANKLRAMSTAQYDDQGRAYAAHAFGVDPTTGAVGSSLDSYLWYDHRGEAVKTLSPSGLVSKAQYDAAGRMTKTFVTDAAPGAARSWADALNVGGDVVLGQGQSVYDADGNTVLSIGKQRFHDDATDGIADTGELGDVTTGPKARVSYAAAFYDQADRPTDTVDVGTNGGAAYAPPSSVPTRSATVLVSSFAYDASGWLKDVTDPRGIVSRNGYDALGRTTSTIQAYTDGTPTNSNNRTTTYSYDGNDNLLTQTAVLPGTSHQTTRYVYGVSTSGGSGLNSKDLMARVEYPDKSTGDASTSSADQETYTYDTLGEAKTLTDRNGTTHTYDRVGSSVSTLVSTLPLFGYLLGVVDMFADP